MADFYYYSGVNYLVDIIHSLFYDVKNVPMNYFGSTMKSFYMYVFALFILVLVIKLTKRLFSINI